jgi:hypothetical protein
MASNELHPDLYGWWRITETSQWVNDGLDDLGPAMISITGRADPLRMHCLLAHVNVRPTKTGASFTWEGAWEYDQMSGTGSVKLGKDGRLRGRIKIMDGDESTFIAERTIEPTDPIPDPRATRRSGGRDDAGDPVARSPSIASLTSQCQHGDPVRPSSTPSAPPEPQPWSSAA